jgi:TonB-linked SusC/RagA family outer membrane protein
VTGSGQATEVKKLGNTVAIIKPPENVPINDVSTLLQGREPGVVMLPSGGLTGEGARIRIRGNASLTQSNEPIVFVDGVRVNSGGGNAANGNVGTSRIDDIDPASIERVEILKGAAAATLYGTEASNGVIQIFTKKGRSGAPKWDFSMQQEAITFKKGQVAPNSFYVKDAATAQRASQLVGFNVEPYKVYETPIFDDYLSETGIGTTMSAQVQGGSDLATYFIGTRYQSEDGPFGNAAFGPSDDLARRVQATINLQLVPGSRFRMGVRNSYTNSFNRSPEANNNIYGSNSLAYMARPEFANCNNSTIVGKFQCSGPGNPFGNQAFMTVRESMQQLNDQRIGRYTGALDMGYKFAEGLDFNVIGGYDFTSQRDVGFSPFGYNLDLFTAQTPDGARFVYAEQQAVLSLDAKLAWNKTFGDNWASNTVAGLQVFNTRVTTNSTSSTNFPGPGIEVVGAGGQNQQVGEFFLTSINGGYFAQEQLTYKDYITLTAGGRYDFASAFGAEAPGVFYPKVSVSYVPSDQEWFSRMPAFLSTLRFRAAWGKSGRQPGAFDKFTTFSPLASELGAGLVPSNLGNPALKPEISSETEFGFEAGLFDNRVAVDFTAWNREINDLLVARQYAVSGGFRNTQLSNIGSMKANGLEIGARWFAVQRPNLSAEFFVNGAYLNQTLTSLGGAPPLKVGYIRYRGFLKEGYPLGALFSPRLAPACGTAPSTNSAGKPIACYQAGSQLPINFNGQGSPATTAQLLSYLSTPRDLKNSGVQAALRPLLADFDGNGNLGEQFVGDVIPDWTGSFGFNTNIGKNWRVSTNFEYRTGFYIQNLTDGFRMSQHPSIGSNRREWSEIESIMNNPASTAQQRLEATDLYINKYRRLLEPGLHQHEKGDFTRWRELAITYKASPELARRLGAGSLSVTAAGRNLMLWTSYPGIDPEANGIGRGAVGGIDGNFLDSVDAFGLPIPRRFVLTVNFGF